MDTALRSNFLMITCQVGAEVEIKRELAASCPPMRLAYSRPGFVTFKLCDDHGLATDFRLGSVFARTYGLSLGKLDGSSVAERVDKVWRLAGCRNYQGLHVWQRDVALPGDRGFEPGVTPIAGQIYEAIRGGASRVGLTPEIFPKGPNAAARPAGRGQLVLDCVVVEPDEWWVGCHRASSQPSRWPGGMKPIVLPDHAVSRTFLKMEEALWWSGLPIRSGDTCVEIGSAPGGASQSLLTHGLMVRGVDPADMNPTLLAEPNFRHYKMRGIEVKRREFSNVHWLVADMNVAPKYTLDTVEAIVTHPAVHVRGLLLTLKFIDWHLASEISNWTARVRSWGFRDVKARQLAHNRREVCLAALRHRSLRRSLTRKF